MILDDDVVLDVSLLMFCFVVVDVVFVVVIVDFVILLSRCIDVTENL